MRASKGTGMTQEQVVKFVNGCEYSHPVYHTFHWLIGNQIILATSCIRMFCGTVFSATRRADSFVWLLAKTEK